MELAELAKLGTEIGLMASLVLFFSWQAWKREARLADRVTTLETFISERMSLIVTENASVLTKVVGVLDRTVTILDRLEDRMDRHDRGDGRA